MGHLAPPPLIPAISRANLAFSPVAAGAAGTAELGLVSATATGRRTAIPAASGVRRATQLVRILALGITLGILSPTAAAAEPESVLARFAGSWHWVGGDGELRAIDDAIEACVKQMNLFIRPIARRRIRKPLQPSTEMVLAAAPGPSLAISRPDRPTVVIPAHGQPVYWRDAGGDSFLISLAIESGTLQQRFEGTSSISFNSYILDPTGLKLTVHTRIVSKRLPAPIEFNTTYQKNP